MPRLLEPKNWMLPQADSSNGCFETMRAYRGRMFRLDDHMDRLYASAKYLGTPLSIQKHQLVEQLVEALRDSKLNEAVVRVALIPPPPAFAEGEAAFAARPSGPAGGGGMMPDQGGCSKPSIVVLPVKLPSASAYRKGIRVAVTPTRKFSTNTINSQSKYSARMNSIMAILDAQARNVDEALFMDAQGYVSESTASNFGIIYKGTLLTAPCWMGLLAGITRDVLFEVARKLRIPYKEVPLTRHDLYIADEAFLTSTIKEVLSVTMIDGRKIGTGKPGPVTQKLYNAFHKLIRKELGY